MYFYHSTERPDLRLVSEYSVLNALQGEPLDGHRAARRLVFIIVVAWQLGQPEVSDLYTTEEGGRVKR